MNTYEEFYESFISIHVQKYSGTIKTPFKHLMHILSDKAWKQATMEVV